MRNFGLFSEKTTSGAPVYSEKGTVSGSLFCVFLSLLIGLWTFYFEKFAWNDTYFPFHMVKPNENRWHLSKDKSEKRQRFLLCIRRRRRPIKQRGRGNFRNRKITPLVGDQVIFESENQTDGYLHWRHLPRKNQLVRPPVTNVDLGIIVTSIVEPAFSYNLLDRFLVTLEYESIEPLIF